MSGGLTAFATAATRRRAMQAAVAAVDTAVHPPTIAEPAPEASTSTVFPTLPLPDDTLSHRERIEQALDEGDRLTLRALASEGAGFEDSELRRRVWCVSPHPLSPLGSSR